MVNVSVLYWYNLLELGVVNKKKYAVSHTHHPFDRTLTVHAGFSYKITDAR